MKNFYALNPGEFFVAQELIKQRPDLKLYFPIKDMGVDLLAVGKKNTPVSIQIKESRTYGRRGFSWHEVKKKKVAQADVFVFVSYVESTKGAKSTFRKDYLVMPRADLKTLCEKKKLSGDKYRFHFGSKGDKLFETREGRNSHFDVTKYNRAWNLI
ncbi:MAG: hypothetical protein Q8P12_07130 [bacterium]|nr:hypothetical protein [bacterium]